MCWRDRGWWVARKVGLRLCVPFRSVCLSFFLFNAHSLFCVCNSPVSSSLSCIHTSIHSYTFVGTRSYMTTYILPPPLILSLLVSNPTPSVFIWCFLNLSLLSSFFFKCALCTSYASRQRTLTVGGNITVPKAGFQFYKFGYNCFTTHEKQHFLTFWSDIVL